MNSVKRLIASALFTAASVTSASGFAQNQIDHSKMDMSNMTEGEIRKVDKDAGKLTIKHGNIRNLDMPAMTMVFQVKDKATLGKLQAGDKIKFKALSENGKLVATEIQPEK